MEKHYPKGEPNINTYGDDDWATPVPEDYRKKKMNMSEERSCRLRTTN